jgi:methylmalonyl-CoA mutase N-terminal domain/subunit
LEKIESLGGAVRCIENGYYHRELGEAAYRYQRQIETNERILVGVNAFQSENEQEIPVFKGNPEMERRQIERVKTLRQTRDNAAVKARLGELADAARGKQNLVPTLVETVKTYATLGEICETLRGVYGVYQSSQVI